MSAHSREALLATENLYPPGQTPERYSPDSNHFIVIGGSVSGAQAAWEFAQSGAHVTVLEKNPDPYGLVKRDLPPDLISTKQKENSTIVKQLSHPNIRFFANFEVGRDITFEELKSLGATDVIWAIGGRKDRTTGILSDDFVRAKYFERGSLDDFRGRGLYFQNDFLEDVNLYAKQMSEGAEQRWLDFPINLTVDTIVQGGGRGSMDVIRYVQFVRLAQKLEEKGIVARADLIDIARYGINATLKKYKLTLKELELGEATLLYRGGFWEMPLYEYDEFLSEADKKTVEEVVRRVKLSRQEIGQQPDKSIYPSIEDLIEEEKKLTLEDFPDLTAVSKTKEVLEIVFATQRRRLQFLTAAMKRSGFRARFFTSPDRFHASKGMIDGYRVTKTYYDDKGKLQSYRQSEEMINTQTLIFATGSTPEPVEGLPMEGSYPKFRDEEAERTSGELYNHRNMHATGMGKTGKGDIRVSREDGITVAHSIIAELRSPNGSLGNMGTRLIGPVAARKIRDLEKLLMSRTRTGEYGYNGVIKNWIEALPPEIMEVNNNNH